MNTNMIVTILFGLVSISALCLSILSLCRSNKERIDTQYIATVSKTNPKLYSTSISDSIENWLSDRQVTFDGNNNVAVGGNLKTATLIVGDGSLDNSTAAIHGDLSVNGAVSSGQISATTLSAPTISATTSLSAPTISATTSLSAPTISATTSLSADSITYNKQTFTNLTRLSGHGGAGCFMCTEQTENSC